MTVEDWQLAYDTNVNGEFVAAKAAFKVMKDQRYGNILVTSSAAGLSA